MNLYIELETYNREIEAKMLLALEAVKRGYSVIIAHRSEIQRLALQNKIPPGIIHMKDANSMKHQLEILKKLKIKKFLFTAQDEESGLLNKTYDNFAKTRFNNFKSFKFLNYFFCWGKRDYEYLKKKIKGAVITGSPRFDLLPLKKIAKKIKTKKKKILVISSFNVTGVRNFADRIFANIGFRDKHTDLAEKTIYHLESIHTLKVFYFVNLVRYLAKHFKNYEISLRPHPTDNFEGWEKLINSKAKNIKIEKVKNLSLNESIIESRLVIQNGCHSAIETLMLRTPCISYVPKEWTEDEMAEFPNSLGIKAKSSNKVAQIIRRAKYYNYSQKEKLLKTRVFFGEKLFSFEKQVNFFDKISKNFENFNPSFLFKQENILKNRLKFVKRKVFGSKKSVIAHKFPKFENKKINKLIKDISLISKKNDYLNTKFKILSERVLYLNK